MNEEWNLMNKLTLVDGSFWWARPCILGWVSLLGDKDSRASGLSGR